MARALMDRMDEGFLAQVGLFAHVAPQYLKAVSALARPRQYPAGAQIMAEGDVGDALYIIESGEVKIAKVVPGAGQDILATLKAQDYFGEMSLVDDAPRSAHAFAVSATRTFVITREDLHELFTANQDIAYGVLLSFVQTLAIRLRSANNRLREVTASTAF